MALAHVQTVKANGGGSAVTSVTTSGITTTSGNLLVMISGQWKSLDPQIQTPSDSKSNTWLEVTGSPMQASANTKFHMWYVKNCLGGASHTFTSTVSNAALMAAIVMEISGADTTSPYDTGAFAGPTSSTTPSSGTTATRSQAAEIIVGACGTGDNVNGGTFSPGSGFTMDANGKETNFNNYVCGLEYQIVSSAGTDAATFTISSDVWVCLAATFKAAGATSAFPGFKFPRQAVVRSYNY